MRFSLAFDLARQNSRLFLPENTWADHVLGRGRRAQDYNKKLRDLYPMMQREGKETSGKLWGPQWFSGPSVLLNYDNWFDVHLSDRVQ
jgi:hypothetical protein